jgi:hypothetical protein
LHPVASHTLKVATTGTKGEMAHRLMVLKLDVPGFTLSGGHVVPSRSGQVGVPLTVLSLLRSPKTVLQDIAVEIGVGKSGAIDTVATRIVFKVLQPLSHSSFSSFIATKSPQLHHLNPVTTTTTTTTTYHHHPLSE